MQDSTPPPKAPPVVFVTGPSGAGRSTAINALEDLGFEAIDNLPLSLLPRLLQGPPPERPLALGTDARNRDYSPKRLIALFDDLQARPDVKADLLYLDCAPEVLRRRYSETRRRHPMAPDADPSDGIGRELALLDPVRASATTLVDTSELTPHALRAEITRLFGSPGAAHLSVRVMSFSYRKGVPDGADIVLDCRFLRNPHWDPDLRAKTGEDPAVQAYIAEDARLRPFQDRVMALLDLLLPGFQDEGKSHLTIAFGCTGGQHRSVALTEMTAAHLAQAGWHVSKRHREMETRPAQPQGAPSTSGA